MHSRSLQLNGFRLLLLVLLFGFVYLFIRQSCELWAIHQEFRLNQLKLEQTEQVHQSLIDEKNRLNTPDYVEKIAREDLGLVKPGEVPYLSNSK